MGKHRPRPVRETDKDWKAPDPEGLLRDLLDLSKQEQEPDRPHDFAMGQVFPINEDDAYRIAASRTDEGVAWEPEAAPAVVQGPFCLACGKVRGPLPVTTKCLEKEPAWLRKHKIDRELANQPRAARRTATLAKRREHRRSGGAVSDLDPSPAQLARAARITSKPRQWADPDRVTLQVGPWTDPEMVEVS